MSENKKGKVVFQLDDAPSTLSDGEADIDINTLPHSNPFPSQVMLNPFSQEEAANWKKTLQAHNEHANFLDKIDLAASAVINGAGFLVNDSQPLDFSLIPPPTSTVSTITTDSSFSRPGSSRSNNDGQEIISSSRPRTAPEKVPSLDVNSDSLDTLLDSLLQSSNTQSLNDLVASTENPGELWRKGVDGKKNRIDIRRNIAFRAFHLTGGEPPKTPPHVPSEEFTPIQQLNKNRKSQNSKSQPSISTGHKYKSYKKFSKKSGEIVMLELSTAPSFGGSGTGQQKRSTSSHPPGSEDYSNISPKVDTGLSQIKKEVKISPDGVPMPEKHYHPLTLGSRLTPKAFEHENLRAKRQQRIAAVTNRLHNNLGSRFKNLREFYVPPNRQPPQQNMQQNMQQQQQMNVGLGTMIGGRFATNQFPGPKVIEILKQRASTFPNAVSTNLVAHYHSSPRGAAAGSLDMRGLNPSMYNGPTANFRYHTVTRSLSYGHQQQGQGGRLNWDSSVRPSQQPQHSQQQQQMMMDQGQNNSAGGKKIYRPSQLLPIHIPGPKHENIYIGPYSEVDGERVKTTPEVAGPMKSRKR